MTTELAPQYQPGDIEQALYRWWTDASLFAPRGDGRPYVIMMPPPNVTAQLHMGHGLNNTIQDAVIRFERMRGRDVLWLPGTDHAGIATQNVVERVLTSEGKTRFDLGREAFVTRVWEHVDTTGATILEQLKAIGASCDWGRTYFTLDEGLSRAVREVFVRLYEKDLVYRGNYIINWCPRCLTALSNEEAEKEEEDGKLWHLRYPLRDGRHLTVATTRPETMLGDTAVAVHPSDTRYAGLIGGTIRLPLVDRDIPIIADDGIDPAFGTGAVKVTPAHDPLDFEIGTRHGLEALNVLTPDARINDNAPARFRGLTREAARTAVVREFEALGLLDRIEDHHHAVGHCYRCGTVVEPRLSEQWFVRMAPLAAPALQAYRQGDVRFIPERRGTEYAQWMEGIRDWCISRQLWWGHRIPVWYCDAPGCERTTVSRTDLTACPGCGGPVRQDEDVLDTWFSSWLVPFSSLGWPERTADLTRFYPGDTLVTAPEILFFWVARMIMAGLEFQGKVPFHTVYLHGTVRDTQHRKMSKSLGNGIDPLEVIERYGADALRYTVISGMAVGTDLILDPADLESSFAAGRNFANKLWNAGRFALGTLDGPTRPLAGPYPDVVRRDELTLPDRWIIARCDATVRVATEAFERFRLNDAAAAVYHFLWSDLADWYIEQAKPRLYGQQPGGDVARAVLAQTFDVALRLLHPVMPFVTETLWKRLPGRDDNASISVAPWPRPDDRATDGEALAEFAEVQQIVTSFRQLCADAGVRPGEKAEGAVTTGSRRSADRLTPQLETIARLGRVRLGRVSVRAAGSIGETGRKTAVLPDGVEVSIELSAADRERECTRLAKEEAHLRQLVMAQEKKLGNEQFVARAPTAVVEGERQKLATWLGQADALAGNRRRLGCG